MKRILIPLVLVAIGAAYLAGYWPERRARVASERALATEHGNLERAEARNRLYGLQSRLLDLQASVEARNFGDAQAKATAFFDAVRAEAGRPDQSLAAKPLAEILADRDSLTIAITQSDAAASQMLRGDMARLRAALGDAPPGVGAEANQPPTPSASQY